MRKIKIRLNFQREPDFAFKVGAADAVEVFNNHLGELQNGYRVESRALHIKSNVDFKGTPEPFGRS